MTNTKFRKRALLSSVAMLLVALVALGSATFAWFQANPNAEAKGLTINATTSAGLLALSSTHNAAKADDWSHNTVLNASTTLNDGKVVASTTAKTLSPVSQNASGSMFSVDAEGEDDFAAAANTNVDGAASGSYYTETVGLKVTGIESGGTRAVKCTGVTWTDGTGNLKNAVRVSLFVGSTYVGTWGSSAIAEDAAETNGRVNNHFLTGTGAYSTVATGRRAILAKGTPSTVQWNANDAGTAGTVTVYVYLDGEHSDVFSSNVLAADAAMLAQNIQINFTLA